MFNALFRTALIGSCLLTLVGCKEDPEGHHAPEPRTLNLPVARVEITAADRLYSTPGSAISQERIEVSSRTTGCRVALNCEMRNPTKSTALLCP